MNKLLLLLILLNFTLSVKVQSFVQKYANKFIALYNAGSYEDIVSTYIPEYQTSNVKNVVVKNLTDIHDNHGDILTNMVISVTNMGTIFMVTFKDDLSIGALAVRVEGKQIYYGMVNYIPDSSFVDQLDQNSDNIGFKFIFDDTTIQKNQGDSFGVEALQLFPVSIEYCNQISQGILKSSKMVSIKEVQKYYIKGYDNNFMNFSLYESQTQSLGSLVKQNLQTPSLAVSEYLVDLLGMDKIMKTMDSLGISQDRTMYPASYYVQMASLSSGYSNTKDFLSKVEDLSDSDVTDQNEQIHMILKTGNSTASKLINLTISQFKSRSVAMKDAINMKNTFSTAGGYADAYYSFVTKDFKLEGNTNTIFNSFASIKNSSALSFGRFGSVQLNRFSGASLEGSASYNYEANGAYYAPKNSNYKSIGYAVFVSGPALTNKKFATSFGYFLINIFNSPSYRSAASDTL